MLPDLATITENFELLDDWDDRYRYLIELGKMLEPLPESARTEDNRVRGCASQVWVQTDLQRPDELIISGAAASHAETPHADALHVDALHVDVSHAKASHAEVPQVQASRGAGSTRLTFRGDSDAHIVKGLVALILAIYSGHTAEEILKIDAFNIFTRLGLKDHLTPQRANGVRAMIERIRRDAAEV